MLATIPINMFLRLSTRSDTRRHALRLSQYSPLFAKSLDVEPTLSSQINNCRHRQLLPQKLAALPEASCAQCRLQSSDGNICPRISSHKRSATDAPPRSHHLQA